MTNWFKRDPVEGEFARLDIVGFISSFIDANGYSPSIREIMKACHFKSTASVAYHLSILRDLGKVEYQDRIARSVRVI